MGIEAGALVRRPIRRFLLARGVPFKEEKGFLDSVFFLDENSQLARNALVELQKIKELN